MLEPLMSADMGASTGGVACHYAETGVKAAAVSDFIWLKADVKVRFCSNLIRQSEVEVTGIIFSLSEQR